MKEAITNFLMDTGFYMLADNWLNLAMIAIACVLCYLAIVKKFEPLLLLPIAIGMLLTNLPGAEMYHAELFSGGHVHWSEFDTVGAGLLDYLYLGVKLGIYPCLIFLGVGAMTDFVPLIANPKSLLLGAAAQVGIFITFLGAIFLGFEAVEAASIGIIGGADGPTAIYVTSKLAPDLLGPIAVAAYSYMALVPVIQPPIMKLLTTKKERQIVMTQLRPVSKTQKIIFPKKLTNVFLCTHNRMLQQHCRCYTAYPSRNRSNSFYDFRYTVIIHITTQFIIYYMDTNINHNLSFPNIFGSNHFSNSCTGHNNICITTFFL